MWKEKLQALIEYRELNGKLPHSTNENKEHKNLASLV